MKALSLIARATGGDYPAILAICSRAHAGLIQGKADLLLVGEERRTQALIPAKFWWAEGHEALEQDWSIGDFSTWIDHKIHLQAFGVRFDFEGLRPLLSAEAAAAGLRELSVSADPSWMSARQARRFMYDQLSANPATAGTLVLDQCRLGLAPAKAQLMQRSNWGQPDRWNLEEREWEVPGWFWSEFTKTGSSSQDWERGVFNGKGQAPDGSCWIRLTGVHFLRAPYEALLPQNESREEPQSTSRGGRPRKEWWDDLWCGIWGQVYRGALVPKTQADLERAMMEWVESRGQAVSESTVKPLARKMFLEMQKEDEN